MEAVFKSNRFLETLLVLLIMLIPTISMADSTTTIPITSSYWESFDINGNNGLSFGTGTLSSTSDGMKVNGVGYRQGAGLWTTNTYNLVGTETYIKWLAYGSGYMSVNAGISYDWLSDNSINTTGLTTDHSYSGSTVISDNTWYYTRIKLNSDRTYTVVTATSNYDDSGGTTIKSSSGTYSGSSWSSYQSAHVMVGFGDNYGGTSAYVVVGESVIKYLTSTTTTTATSTTTTTTTGSPTTLTIKKQ
ncbi:MAG: hypothetical protein HQK92_05155, partial [Nitrospirae bacterium]|nr:hypothetical protein [Nitrospirota bacterium]